MAVLIIVSFISGYGERASDRYRCLAEEIWIYPQIIIIIILSVAAREEFTFIVKTKLLATLEPVPVGIAT